jgi:hypothetical protein
MVASIHEQVGIGLHEILLGKGTYFVEITRRCANGQDEEEEPRTFRQIHRSVSDESNNEFVRNASGPVISGLS